MLDRDVASAMAGSFLRQLPADLVYELMARGGRVDYPGRGHRLSGAVRPEVAARRPRAGPRLHDLPEGQQVTIRYAGERRPRHDGLIATGSDNVVILDPVGLPKSQTRPDRRADACLVTHHGKGEDDEVHEYDHDPPAPR
jgi:hypothetical protein